MLKIRNMRAEDVETVARVSMLLSSLCVKYGAKKPCYLNTYWESEKQTLETSRIVMSSGGFKIFGFFQPSTKVFDFSSNFCQ